MNAAAKMFTSLLDSNGTNYSIVNEEEGIIRVGWNMEGTRMTVYTQFSENERNIHMEGHEFLSFPSDKIDAMYKICNDCNREYRWMKFSVDKEENRAIVECDAVIQLDSCADEVMELMLRMVRIVETAYPQIMKALWA